MKAVILMIYLELDIVSILLDLDALSILPPSLQEEVLDLLDLAGHLDDLCKDLSYRDHETGPDWTKLRYKIVLLLLLLESP